MKTNWQTYTDKLQAIIHTRADWDAGEIYKAVFGEDRVHIHERRSWLAVQLKRRHWERERRGWSGTNPRYVWVPTTGSGATAYALRGEIDHLLAEADDVKLNVVLRIVRMAMRNDPRMVQRFQAVAAALGVNDVQADRAQEGGREVDGSGPGDQAQERPAGGADEAGGEADQGGAPRS